MDQRGGDGFESLRSLELVKELHYTKKPSRLFKLRSTSDTCRECCFFVGFVFSEVPEEQGGSMCWETACISRATTPRDFPTVFFTASIPPKPRSNLALLSSLRPSVCCFTKRKLQEENVVHVSWPHIDQNNLIRTVSSHEKTCRTSVNQTFSTKFV